MKIKRMLSMVLAIMMVVGLLPVSAFAAGAAYTDGTYTAAATVQPDEWEDFAAYDISVDVTVEGGKVANVTFSEGNTFGDDDENASYSERAMNGRGSRAGVAAQVVANNGVEGVDAVATATCTSNAIIAAVTTALEQAAASAQNSGYVLLNIPYDEFYAAEGVEGVDAVTTATVKTYNQTMAGGSYHEGYAAADPISDAAILGVTYPVYVEDLSVLEGFTQVTDETTATITVAAGKSSLTEKEVSGTDVLFASGTYAYYIMSEAPNAYKTLTVNEDGSFSFSAVNAEPVKSEGMEAELSYGGHYTDIEFSVAADEITDTCVVNAITLTTSEGEEYALRHVEDIWRKTGLGWNWDSLDGNGLSGKTITAVTYYVVDNGSYAVYEYAVNETVKLNPGTVTAAFTASNTIVLNGLPADIQNATATVKTKVGRGETATVIAENVAVENGTIVTTDPATLATYVITIISDNYGDISVNADCTILPFTDVEAGSFYEEPVRWAVSEGITNGMTATTFGPNGVCNRAQIVTFLWRAAGSPAPTTTECVFTDVEEGSFYYEAVLWAVENGITNGMTATTFGPTRECNRAQAVTFLWRALGCEQAENTTNIFTDVEEGSFYCDAVLWAVEKGITNGVTATTFAPNAVCNRAHIVTFLYRAYAN